MAYVKVEGSSSLARDPHSGAIININKDEIAKARLAKKQRENKNREFEELKNEVSELKELLNKLVEKL
tara:strand:- start:1076 stop:1279 length:204 start_codon:yes stop_codon:yes gene_type:complete